MFCNALQFLWGTNIENGFEKANILKNTLAVLKIFAFSKAMHFLETLFWQKRKDTKNSERVYILFKRSEKRKFHYKVTRQVERIGKRFAPEFS